MWGERNCLSFETAVGGIEPPSPRLTVWRSTMRPPLRTPEVHSPPVVQPSCLLLLQVPVVFLELTHSPRQLLQLQNDTKTSLSHPVVYCKKYVYIGAYYMKHAAFLIRCLWTLVMHGCHVIWLRFQRGDLAEHLWYPCSLVMVLAFCLM